MVVLDAIVKMCCNKVGQGNRLPVEINGDNDENDHQRKIYSRSHLQVNGQFHCVESFDYLQPENLSRLDRFNVLAAPLHLGQVLAHAHK